MAVYSNMIFSRLLSLQSLINTLSFTVNDVRSYYFDMIKSNLLGYYNGYLSFEINRKIANDSNLQQSLSLSANQINRVSHIYSSEHSMSAHLSHYNRNLIISSWSIFELVITTICDFALTERVKSELLSYEYEEVRKKLKMDENADLQKKLTKKHLAHVPIQRKVSKLFDLAKPQYSRDMKQDKYFLNFLGDFRNTIHSNFIYYGSENKTYGIDGVDFLFVVNRVVRYSTLDPFSPELHLNLIFTLIEISKELILALNIQDEIIYPDLNAENDIWMG